MLTYLCIIFFAEILMGTGDDCCRQCVPNEFITIHEQVRKNFSAQAVVGGIVK